MNYENGSLRYITANNSEIIRMIYCAVRDKEWLTLKSEISDETREINYDSFQIKYKSRFRSSGIDFLAKISITGSADNSLVFTFEGVALNSFEKNRIGICILHPVETCAGRNCIIEHTDGSSEQSFFPEEISPVQVFRNIRSMKWLSDRTSCRIDYEGDIFETEDQRNWCDDSFKTYPTPLSIPYPVQICEGTRISQKITIIAEGISGTHLKTDDLISIRLLPEKIIKFPETGICRSTRNLPLSNTEKRILRSLHFDHYRVDLKLFIPGWEKEAENAFDESSALGWPLELALFMDDEYENQINDFLTCCNKRKPTTRSVFIFHKDHPSTPDEMALRIIPLIREVMPDTKTGTGTNANFAELNRNRPGDTGNDFVFFSIHPQEHASDNLTLVENLKVQKQLVDSAVLFSKNKGIYVSPVTLQRRFNASISYYELPYEGNDIPPQIDSRQLSLLGACWTAASFKYLCESGAESLTFYETVGERGLMQGETDTMWQSAFPSSRGMIFPVWSVFRYLLANKDLAVIKSISSEPHLAECLAMTDGRKIRGILVNLSNTVQNLSIECCTGLFRITSLNTMNHAEAISDYRWSGKGQEKVIKSDNNLTIDPCSINFIEGWLKH